MKIDYAIMSSNDNPMYLDFWEPVAKCWESMGITPLLFYFGEKNIKDERVIKVEKLLNYSESIQTLWVRYFAPKLLDPEKVSIISDIDMIPLSKNYFCKSIEELNDDFYVHLNPCFESYGRLPSCYHVAKNKKFIEVLELDKSNSFSDSISSCLNFKEKHQMHHDKDWYADENYATHLVFKNHNNKVALIKRPGGQAGRRIDRITNDFWAEPYSTDLIKSEFYFDCHSIRPYSKHKNEIDLIVDSLLTRNK
jgi:hypothetical protein